MSKEVVHSFAIGDYVKFARQKRGSIMNFKGQEGHITDVSMIQGKLEYGFEGCSWFPHSCFDLIARATPESLKHVAKMQADEDDDEDDDDVYNAEDAHEMSAAAQWFVELDTDLSVENGPDLGDNVLLVTSTNESLLEIFDRTTEFDLAANMNTSGTMATVIGEDLQLIFTFNNPKRCTVSFYDVSGGDVDEVTTDMLREFDPYSL